ncbi:uncharacterized protein [Dermacentor albipictus]|uniref:uncharacterized protein isoform X1 n=1 Tax=Dermacentor albipictus TaxID=60249 RepID=UPI0038FD2C1F
MPDRMLLFTQLWLHARSSAATAETYIGTLRGRNLSASTSLLGLLLSKLGVGLPLLALCLRFSFSKLGICVTSALPFSRKLRHLLWTSSSVYYHHHVCALQLHHACGRVISVDCAEGPSPSLSKVIALIDAQQVRPDTIRVSPPRIHLPKIPPLPRTRIDVQGGGGRSQHSVSGSIHHDVYRPNRGPTISIWGKGSHQWHPATGAQGQGQVGVGVGIPIGKRG